ncbi:MAG: N-acetylmuramoyl-L-alanine amidase [Candidatus Cloacimonadaceae bacterium]
MINRNMQQNVMRIILAALFLIVLSSLSALTAKDSLRVNTKGSDQTKYLLIYKIDDKNYCDVEETAAFFKASVKEERSDKRIYFTIYDEQFIFLINSAFFTFKNNNYKYSYPLTGLQGKYYLPLEFVTSLLPQLFEDKVSWNGKQLIITKPADYTIKTIVIDPGHGGKDPGALGRTIGAKEKDINLSVSLMLKSILEKELGVKVLLTRSDDRFVSLQQRTKFANDNKADLFISVHTNASHNRTSRGIEMYYLSTAKTTEARAVEALENSVVEIYEGGQEALRRYNDVDLILSDILQAENLEHSNNLAFKLQMNMCAGTQSSDRGIKQANFYVLRGAFMPAVLVEMGFISNSVEESFLVNRQYQERLARTIFEGIKSFKFRYDRIRTS